MKATALKGLAVVDLSTAQKIGTIQDIMLNVFTGKIEAFVVKPLKGSADVTVSAAQVQNVGQDALTFKSTGEPETAAQSSTKGVTDAGIAYLSGLVNHYKMVSQGGTLIGQIKDVLIDPAQLVVTGYDVSEGGLFAKTRTLAMNPDIRFGQELAIVPESTAPLA